MSASYYQYQPVRADEIALVLNGSARGERFVAAIPMPQETARTGVDCYLLLTEPVEVAPAKPAARAA